MIYHGQLKENLFLPLFNTNFISKFEINAFEMGATSGAGTAYPSGAPELTPGF
jgi:hypothetical protein